MRNKVIGSLIFHRDQEDRYIVRHLYKPLYFVCNESAKIIAECLYKAGNMHDGAELLQELYELDRQTAKEYICRFVAGIKSADYTKLEYDLQRPLRAAWKVTNKCNLNCLHCYTRANQKEYNELNLKQCFRVVEKLADAGIMDLLLTGGEPLLKDNILDILSALDSIPATKSIFSNGTLIPQMADNLLPYDISWFISIDGPEESHDALRGKGSFRKTMEAIDILRLNRKNVTINTVLNRYNADNLDKFIISLLEKECKVQINLLISDGRAIENQQKIGLSWEDLIYSIKKITKLILDKDHMKDSISFVTESEDPFRIKISEQGSDIVKDSKWHCNAGLTKIIIGPDGTVYPCSLAPGTWILGNILEDDMDAIWRHPNRREFLSSHLYTNNKASNNKAFCNIVEGKISGQKL